MDMRQLKALEIAARLRITWEDGAWSVPSASGNGKYQVVLKPEGNTCTCPDHERTRQDCKHILACLFVVERDYGGKPLPIGTDTLPVQETYQQDWPKYDEAQTTEKPRLQKLLFEVCSGIPEPPPPERKGRPRVPLADAVSAACYKTYVGFSARRFACDLQDAVAKGYLSRSIHFSSVNASLEKAALTPILHSLITQTSLPLQAVETVFAPDSSGFTTSRYTRWYDVKYGRLRAEADWVKVHLIAGTKTHIITAAIIAGKDAHDAPHLAELVKKTADNFTIKEVPADKGYLSAENVEVVAEHGGEAFIAPKSNTTGAVGGLFEKMFHYYQFRRDDFLKHYHQRSNVETTYAMVKAKFAGYVRSKTDTAMMN